MVDKTSSGEPVEFWFNLKTGLVEAGKQSAAPYRVGPFDTEDEAANALKTITNRTAKWNDEEDERD